MPVAVDAYRNAVFVWDIETTAKPRLKIEQTVETDRRLLLWHGQGVPAKDGPDTPKRACRSTSTAA